MDKKTVIGLVLITLIIIGFSIMNRPSEEQLAHQRAYNDSVALAAQMAEAEKQATQMLQEANATLQADTTSADSATVKAQIGNAYGAFAKAAFGEENFAVLENENLKITLSGKGGRISSANLKNYRKHDSLPLILFDGDESSFGFTLVTNNNRVLNTGNLYFEPQAITTDANGNQRLAMRLQTDSAAYIDFVYTLPQNGYMVDIDIESHGMEKVLPLNTNYLEMQWNAKIRQQERGRQFEERYAQVQYKFVADKNVEELSAKKTDRSALAGKVKWVAFKDQFFSSVLIADEAFTSVSVESAAMSEASGYMKDCKSSMAVAYDPTGAQPTKMQMYLGPNHFKTLMSYNDKDLPKSDRLQLHKLVPLGMNWYAWINRIAVIPLFNLFSRWFSNFGIIILLMTIVIKLVIFPFTYKSYLSSAKMRVLKPEIDEINARIPADKMQERQQATMALYQKVGVSPMSGCLPMLFQMPILLAMFSFFPTSIELRQQSFLWATDLSSFDAIVSWDKYIPLITPYFGNHISLFCLLMTVTNIIYTKINMAATAGNDQMPAMKWMMYLMPVMFLFIFNNYAAGLSYYYFVSLLITILQTYAFRLFIDDDKLLAQLHAKRAKNEKSPKKSGFAARLEKMQREQQAYAREQSKKRYK